MEYQNKTITLKDGRTALLRAVCKEDAIPMIAYMKACYEQTPYLMRYPDEFAVTAEQEATYLERQLVSPDVLMLVCEVEGKLAGNCQLDLNRWRKTRHRGQVAIALLKDDWALPQDGFCVHRRKAQRHPAGGWKLLKRADDGQGFIS